MKKEPFYEYDPCAREFVPREGERVPWGDRVGFVYRNPAKGWFVVEAVTGMRVHGEGKRTRRDALAAAEKQLETYKGKIEDAAAYHIGRNGRSPWKGGDA